MHRNRELWQTLTWDLADEDNKLKILVPASSVWPSGSHTRPNGQCETLPPGRSHRGQSRHHPRSRDSSAGASKMPLKLKLAAHERLIVNGAVMVNGGCRTTLIIRNFAHIMREKDVLQEGTPIRPPGGSISSCRPC